MTRILFTTTNGTGLGHLTRSMAIARRLPDGLEPVVLTLSQAMPVAAAEGFFAEFLCSYEYGTMDGSDWNAGYERRLHHLVELYEPALVVFDGVYPYPGLTWAMTRLPDVPFVWTRRAMWKPGVGEEHLRDEGLFRGVLEPGEYAAERDRGPTVARRHRAQRLAPIVYLDPEELLDREDAARSLGLDPERPAVLLQLGSGPVRSIETAAGQILDRLRRAEGLQITVAESVIGGTPMDLPEGVHRARVYPLARYSAAFDFAVAAPGYNLFHEALAYGLPSLFVPKRDATRDDQDARARWAASRGVAAVWDAGDPGGLDDALTRMLDPAQRDAMRAAMAGLPPATGAREAADWLALRAGHAPVAGPRDDAPSTITHRHPPAVQPSTIREGRP